MLTKDFILAGDAIFTVTCSDIVEYMTHTTYRVRRVEFEAKPADNGGPRPRVFWFAYLLTGPDNTSDYTYICKVDEETGALRATAKSRAHVDKTRVWKILEGALRLVWSGEEVVGVEIAHAGRCGRCGRLLTDPTSIEFGIGPVCRSAMEAGT